MFWKRRIKVNPNMIKAIKPTSKATTKMQCLLVCNGDVEKAEKLYDFFVKDMPDIPDFDPTPTSGMQQFKDTAMSLFGWAKDNQNEIMGAVDFIRNLKSGNANVMPPSPPTNLPPL